MRLPFSLIALLAVAFALPQPALAGQDGSSAKQVLDATLTSAADGIDASGLSDAQQAELRANLDTANKLEREAAEFEAKTAALQAAANQAPADVLPTPTSTERQTQLAQWQASLPASADAETLERVLAQERSAISQLRAHIDSDGEQLASSLSRPAEVVDTLAILRRKVSDSAGAPVTVDGEPAALYEGRRLLRAAEQHRAQAELALAQAEQETANARQHQLDAGVQGMRRELSLREPRVAWLGQRIAQLNADTLKTRVARLEADASTLSAQGGPIAELAQRNADYVNQLLDNTRSLAADRKALEEYERINEQVTSLLHDTEARLSLGSGAAIGYWLWQQRINAPSTHSLGLRQRDIDRELAELRLARYDLGERRRDNSKPDTSSANHPADAQQLATQQLREEGLLNELDALLARRIDTLQNASQLLATLSQHGSELRALMDRELLWVPSHPPIDREWLATLPSALVQGVRTIHGGTILRLLGEDIRRSPLRYLLMLVVFAGLTLLRLRIPARLATIAGQVRDVYHDHFALTVRAFGWTLLMSLPLPVTLWLLGGTVERLGAGQVRDIEALGQTLIVLSMISWALNLSRALIAPNGLAQAHLRWPERSLRNLRWAWRITAALLLPTAFMGVWAMLRQVDQAVSVHARLALIVFALGFALLVWQVLHRADTWPGLRAGWRRLANILCTLPFLLVAGLAVAGYVYSATELIVALLNSLAVLLLAQVIYSVLMRWLLLGERALALKQVAHDEDEVLDVESGEARDGDANDVELVTVSAQSRRLLRLLRIGLLLLGLFFAWAALLPALLRFDGITLWHFSSKGAGGEIIQNAVTLFDLIVGLVVLAMTVSVARNLPGFTEIVFSSSKRVGASMRYTITTLLRYGVVIIGTVAAFSMFGLRWSQLQWMAAALTVGLGFGLQEIFANFVSGLILLVERPFRVGDIVTVDGITGTVTRIRTRATTVQDFDNKEMIIPNKTFITGKVVNWTLSDNVTRLNITVGVGYGSDPDKVHALLLQVAREHPQVLAEPPPRSWFVALGASTLDFELRVFVANIGDRLSTTSGLHGRIIRLFQQNNIEIAFPQMDIHVRDMPGSGAGDDPAGEAADSPNGPG
ncbi:MAG: mechanosensitive ion channel [Pseudomonadota bacterium]|nr:mechanosensitive ion channel [Pseudomonadota bacterium]